MDQDSISSFLAQMNRGLRTKIKEEMRNTNSYGKQEENSKELSGGIKGGIPVLAGNAEGQINRSHGESRMKEIFWDQIEEKELHDYAFDQVYDCLKQDGRFKNQDLEIGDAVYLKTKMMFMDFDYFARMYQEDGAIYYSVKTQRDGLTQLKKEVPKGTKVPSDVKMQIQITENSIKKEEAIIKEHLEVIRVLKNTIPYKHFAMTENTLILLDDKCFRDDPDVVPFKYGGELNVVGYVTNTIQAGVQNQEAELTDFRQVYETLNTVLLELYQQKTKIVVIHPLAIYY